MRTYREIDAAKHGRRYPIVGANGRAAPAISDRTPLGVRGTPRLPDDQIAHLMGVIGDVAAGGDLHALLGLAGLLAAATGNASGDLSSGLSKLAPGLSWELPPPTFTGDGSDGPRPQRGGLSLDEGGTDLGSLDFDPVEFVSQDGGGGYNPWTMRRTSDRVSRSDRGTSDDRSHTDTSSSSDSSNPLRDWLDGVAHSASSFFDQFHGFQIVFGRGDAGGTGRSPEAGVPAAPTEPQEDDLHPAPATAPTVGSGDRLRAPSNPAGGTAVGPSAPSPGNRFGVTLGGGGLTPPTAPEEPADPDSGGPGSRRLAAMLMPRWMRDQELGRHRFRTSNVQGRPSQDGTSQGPDRAGHQFAYHHAPTLVDAPERPDPAAVSAAAIAQARAIRVGVGPGGRPIPPAVAEAIANALVTALASRGP